MSGPSYPHLSDGEMSPVLQAQLANDKNSHDGGHAWLTDQDTLEACTGLGVSLPDQHSGVVYGKRFRYCH